MNLRGGIALIKKSIFSYVASRGFFWTLTLGWMMLPLIYMLIWTVAAGEGAISGFTSHDFITYYTILIFVNQLTYPTSHWTVGENIKNGTFSVWLLRPLPPIYEAIASDIALKIVCLPFVGLFILVINLIVDLKIETTFIFIGTFTFSLVMSQVLRFVISYTLAIMALFKAKIDSLLRINNTLVFILAGLVIPTMLLPDFIRNIGVFSPYRYMVGFPVEILIGKLSNSQMIEGICIQGIWIIIAIIINRVVWKRGLKRYSSVGG